MTEKKELRDEERSSSDYSSCDCEMSTEVTFTNNGIWCGKVCDENGALRRVAVSSLSGLINAYSR